MRYAQISVLIAVFFLCLLSCRETLGESRDSPPKENSTLPSQKRETENPKTTIPAQKPQQKEIKKKKQKASDTLKPKIAVLEELQ